MYNKKTDGIGSKRLSVSSGNSFSSLNTYKSMSTYQTYLTVSTEKFGPKGLNRNDSQRLLDSLEFTAEEEMLIKTFRRNASKRSLSSKPSIPTYTPPDSAGAASNGHYKEKREFRFGNSGPQYLNETRNLSINTKISAASPVSPSHRVEHKDNNGSNDKKHKKTKSWAFNSRDKNVNEPMNLNTEDGFTSPSFVKQHKKKNSSFSLKNLFKKPNNQTEVVNNTATAPQDRKSKLSPKYDSFETLEHFQNNGNDEEFLSSESSLKERDSTIVTVTEHKTDSSVRALSSKLKTENNKHMNSVKPRKNLISLEGFAEQRKEFTARDVESTIMTDIIDIESSIEEYLANAILLKQNSKFNESTDCLLLAILEYKKKFVLLQASSKRENLNDRTPFLLYGIALKMGIGSSIDIYSSTENLKIAAGLSSPVESNDDDINKTMFDNTSYKNLIDENNLIIAQKFKIKCKEQTYGMVGPALYELASNYLYNFLSISIDQSSPEILKQTNSYSLSEIKDGLNYLSLSILVYNHLDSYVLMLEIFAYGIKIAGRYLIKPNKNSYHEWLKICEQLDIELDAKLQNVEFNPVTTPTKAKKPGMKRSDTLERLNQLKLNKKDPNTLDAENEYLSLSESDSDVHDETMIEISSIGTSFTNSKKNEFENGAQNMFINYESEDDLDEDDDLSDIMNTYT